MFKSLKNWVNIPFSYRPFIKHNGTGSKEFGDTIQSLCYPDGTDKVITTKEGKEIVSTTQLYVTGDEPINVLDNVILHGHETEVKNVSYFYRRGEVDIKVVYL